MKTANKIASGETHSSSRSGTIRSWVARTVRQAGIAVGVMVLCLFLVGLSQRIGWIQSGGGTALALESVEAAATEFTCPMHPEIRQDTEGKCPICGMALVPVAVSSNRKAPGAKAGAEDERYICPMMCTPPQGEPGKCPVCAMDLVLAEAGGGGERSVSIDAAARRILGIRTATVERKPAYRTIRSIGQLAYDQERMATIAAYVDGRIEEMYAEYEGVEVAKGDDLALVYSPALYSAQVEYLSSLDTPALSVLGNRNDKLSDVAQDNLQELGMTPSQIDRLLTTRQADKRLRITAPITGTVVKRFKVEGDYIKTGEPIYRVVDLSTVWLMLDLYPSDAARVRFGQEVQAEVQSFPGEVSTGRIAFIDPMVSDKTRTVGVRVELSNFDGRLKPGDYATATIRVPAIPRDEVYDPALAGKWISPMHPQIVRTEPGICPICQMDLVPTTRFGYAEQPPPDDGEIVVPRGAVLMAGDNSVVYVETKPGEFELREVTIAALTDESAVMLDGLTVGETVATDGNFLIDSQMQLGGKPSLMDPSRGEDKNEGDAPMPAMTEAPHAH
ncbi:efflux RND transporter periplasmic adaptor subunit [Botrimarina hoheduenensis]|uniref:Cation efflux system protein CusB n=1 Tax=Botrimarina hoheduenensis TaxID=2528000 RepID=A0A5C5VYK5_9BACT|nr:efflux RND transporter periplasmic adaptor subunit [Botrimarina hoheduenensis]TWT43510.1 Cation efflux system protein CusB precursor [Botrimarina hoheduenensis]